VILVTHLPHLACAVLPKSALHIDRRSWRSLYSLHRGYDRLDADAPDGTRFLRIGIPRRLLTSHWSRRGGCRTQRRANPRRVVIAVTYGVILEKELAGERCISVQ